MHRGRRARRHQRAQAFGAHHPRLTLILVSLLVVGVIALDSEQLSYGTYLGRSWVIAAAAGIVTAVAVNAAAWVSNRRHRPASFPLVIAWLVLAVMSASAIRIPFPQGPYSNVMAFFNVAHAAMLVTSRRPSDQHPAGDLSPDGAYPPLGIGVACGLRGGILTT